MNRIDAMFSRKREEGKKALITFVTAGDPDVGTTRRIVLALEAAGRTSWNWACPIPTPWPRGR